MHYRGTTVLLPMGPLAGCSGSIHRQLNQADKALDGKDVINSALDEGKGSYGGSQKKSWHVFCLIRPLP